MKIDRLDNFGRGITYYNDKIMFVNNALPNEIIDIDNIMEEKKFYVADATKIDNDNINRIVPKCPYYKECGGCNIMHMNLDYQEEFKLNKVKEILKKYANIDMPIRLIKNDKDLFYRNKVTLKINNHKYGYFSNKSHDFIEINSCLLINNVINEFINGNYIDIIDGEITIRSNYQGLLLISIYSNQDVKINYDKLQDNIVGIVINKKTVYKDNYIYDMIGDLRFKISYDSFFQVNNYMASCIFDILRSNLNGNNLLDLYCGVGTLGLAVKDNFNAIYGVEKIKNAISNAKDNASLNGIKNTHYYAGNTNDIIKKLNVKFDTIILDPPRSGLNQETIKQVIDILPKTIAYVSCDPMTLARDLKILSDKYKINKINVLDMFPNTYHVETVCVLERKN